MGVSDPEIPCIALDLRGPGMKGGMGEFPPLPRKSETAGKRRHENKENSGPLKLMARPAETKLTPDVARELWPRTGPQAK